MLKIVPYQPGWPGEFHALGRSLRQALGDRAVRIDHIGSTSVPGLAAKDIIDVQVTVADLTAPVERAFNRAGYQRLEAFTRDHLPPGSAGPAGEWVKWLFRPPAGQRPANIHVRISGRANQRYALLFRDYLRAQPAAALAYARVKEALVKYHPNDVEAYYDVKDPVCDILIGGAEVWAVATNWTVGPGDC
jgi:GrpB-like predicted nucleotidyltransferase (UPF0157 family)